jgi:phage nucleotide-binding protein
VGDIDNPRSWCIYGKPGTGKTTLFSTFPKPSLLLDFKERGTDSIADVRKIDVAKIRHSDEVEALYWEAKRGRLDYKCIGFDTVSQFQELLMFEETGKKDTASWGAVSRKAYQNVGAKLKRFITDFCELDDYEVVFMAHERVFNIPDEDEVADDLLMPEIGPRLMPSIRDVLNAQVGVIGQTYVRLKRTKTKDDTGKTRTKERIQYCLWIGPDAIRTAKIRKPRSVVLPSYLIDPTYEDLMSVIKGEE